MEEDSGRVQILGSMDPREEIRVEEEDADKLNLKYLFIFVDLGTIKLDGVSNDMMKILLSRDR